MQLEEDTRPGALCACVCLRVHACVPACARACARMHVCFSFNLICVQALSLERPSLSVFSLAGRVGAECGSEKGPGSGPGGDALVRGAGPCLTGMG